MKRYLFDTLNKYKRFSENLDVKTILCNKSWCVFNDSGEKEVYIFQEDGSLIISLSGIITAASWKYILANKSLVIESKEQSYMLHPSFIDNVIFALQLDGTEQYSFMIDETQRDLFQLKSLSDIKHYFENKEQKIIEEEQKSKRLEIETKQQKAEIERENIERKRQELAERKERERYSAQMDLLHTEIVKTFKPTKTIKFFWVGGIFVIMTLMFTTLIFFPALWHINQSSIPVEWSVKFTLAGTEIIGSSAFIAFLMLSLCYNDDRILKKGSKLRKGFIGNWEEEDNGLKFCFLRDGSGRNICSDPICYIVHKNKLTILRILYTDKYPNGFSSSVIYQIKYKSNDKLIIKGEMDKERTFLRKEGN